MRSCQLRRTNIMLWNVKKINKMSYVRKFWVYLLNNLLEVIDFKSRGKLFQSLQPLYFIHLCPVSIMAAS